MDYQYDTKIELKIIARADLDPSQRFIAQVLLGVRDYLRATPTAEHKPIQDWDIFELLRVVDKLYPSSQEPT